MASSFADLGKRRRLEAALVDAQDDALSVRETTIRKYSELFAGFGLLLLIVALLVWNAATLGAFSDRSIIQIPDELLPYVATGEKPFNFRADQMLAPYGQTPLAAFILLLTFGALVRKRITLTWVILAVGLFPWSFLSVDIPGLGISSAAILLYMLFGAARRKDRLMMALCAALLFGYQGVFDIFRPDESVVHKEVTGVSLASLMRAKNGSSSFEALNVPPALAAAKAYVYAQEKFLKRDDRELAKAISRIPEDAFPHDTTEARRVAFMRLHLADVGILADSSWLERQQLALQRYFSLFVGVFAALAIAASEALEYLSRRVFYRADRITLLKASLEPQSFRTAVPSAGSKVNDAVGAVEHRAYVAAALTASLVVCAIAMAVLSLWWAPASSGSAFQAVHLLRNVALDVQANGIAIQINDDPFAGFMASKLVKWIVLATLLLAGLCAIFGRSRWAKCTLAAGALLAFSSLVTFLLAAVLSLVVMRSRDRLYQLTGSIVFAASLAFTGVSYFGMLHAGRIETTEFQEVQRVYKSRQTATDKNDRQDLNLEAGYRYALAQISYLANDVAGSEEQIHWIYANAVPTSDLARQRLALMRRWLIDNGDDPDGPGRNDTYVLFFDFIARLSSWARLLSGIATCCAALAGIMTVILFSRRRRMRGMADDFFGHVLKGKLPGEGRGGDL